MATNEAPAEQTPSPASPTDPSGPSGRASFHSHSRPLSMVVETAPVRSNRFSLQFPIQSSRVQSPERASHTPVSDAGGPSADSAEAAVQDGNYLHLIAAQERRVLELKEELERAEVELNRLKIDWARLEASKKRDDAKRIMRLQPLSTAFPVSDREDDPDGSSAWMQHEMERRKALLSASRSTHRTVLPGQKHTRTLSLLSTRRDSKSAASSHPSAALPPRQDSLTNPTRSSVDLDQADLAPHTMTRSATMSDIREASQPLDPEALMRAGKKVASGLTDGLWTFWEDLRQATVGEETSIIHPPRRQSSNQTLKTARKQSSKNSLRESPRGSSTAGRETKQPTPGRKKSSTSTPATGLADPSFWSDHGITLAQPPAQNVTKKSTAAKQEKHAEPAKRQSSGSNDGWDTWDDSPVQSRSSSSVTSETATLPSTVSGSPRTSISINRNSRDLTSKRDSIPWPALKKNGLGTLRRTASHLLTEWERSLTPSPGSRDVPGDDYMGAGAEASAYSAASGGGAKGKHD